MKMYICGTSMVMALSLSMAASANLNVAAEDTAQGIRLYPGISVPPGDYYALNDLICDQSDLEDRLGELHSCIFLEEGARLHLRLRKISYTGNEAFKSVAVQMSSNSELRATPAEVGSKSAETAAIQGFQNAIVASTNTSLKVALFPPEWGWDLVRRAVIEGVSVSEAETAVLAVTSTGTRIDDFYAYGKSSEKEGARFSGVGLELFTPTIPVVASPMKIEDVNIFRFETGLLFQATEATKAAWRQGTQPVPVEGEAFETYRFSAQFAQKAADIRAPGGATDQLLAVNGVVGVFVDVQGVYDPSGAALTRVFASNVLDNSGSGIVSASGSEDGEFIDNNSINDATSSKNNAAGYDLEEQNDNCDANTWEGNYYDTSSGCVD